MNLHTNHEQILDVLSADPTGLIEWAAERLIALGAKSEWSMDDNFQTTESLARLATAYNLPPAGDQPDAALIFYGDAAVALGYQADMTSEEG